MPGAGVRLPSALRCLPVLAVLLFVVIPVALSGISGPAAAAATEDRANALTYIEHGVDAYRMGDLVEATRRWGEAIRLCRLAGDTSGEADVLARRGEAFQSLGQLEASAADFHQALRSAETLGDPVRLAALSGALGNVYFQAHDFSKARPRLERSLSLAFCKQLESNALQMLSQRRASGIPRGDPHLSSQLMKRAVYTS